jgi:hypothetical protein
VVVLPGAFHGLLDREAEIAAIEDALARAASGDGGVLVFRGPAGIGKSALLRAGQRVAKGAWSDCAASAGGAV